MNNLQGLWFNYLEGWGDCRYAFRDWRNEFFLQNEFHAFSREVFFTYLGRDWGEAAELMGGFFTTLYKGDEEPIEEVITEEPTHYGDQTFNFYFR